MKSEASSIKMKLNLINLTRFQLKLESIKFNLKSNSHEVKRILKI